MAAELVRRGHEVTIFAAGFSHLERREERLRRGQLYRVVIVEGVRFVWIRTVPYRRNDIWRVANMVSYMIAVLLIQFRFTAPDVIIGSTVHPLAAFAGLIAARLRSARFFYEVRDLWPQTLIDIGAMGEKALLARALRAVERILTKRAEAVLTVLPGMGAYAEERGLPVRRLTYLPNGASLDEVRERPLPDSLGRLIAKHRAAGRFLVAYVGLFATHNNLSVVLHAARELRQDDANGIQLLMIGDGPHGTVLRRTADEQNLTNVDIVAPIPKDAVALLLSQVDAGLLHVTASPIYRYGTSFNKLYDYMAAQRPVVFACRTPYDPVAEAGCGLTVEPDSATALADGLRELACLTQEQRDVMGRAGRRYVEENHDIRRLAYRLEQRIAGD